MESIFKNEQEIRILDLCARHLGPLGFHTVDVDCRLASRSLVRIFIERQVSSNSGNPNPESQPIPESRPTTSIEDCAVASRLLSEVLDSDTTLSGPFDLEVSSPGLDRRLRVRSDFEREIGEEIKLKLVEKLEGYGANLTGKLEGVEVESVKVSVPGKLPVAIPMEKIKQANRVWHFK